jgi:hypothetical protein
MKKIKLNNENDSDIKQLILEITLRLKKETLVIWACSCVEHVLPFFEENYPNDKRPRKALEVARAWLKGEKSVDEVRSAAFESHAAARGVEDSKAYAVARSAGHAAATVHATGHAVHAANYAAKVDPNERLWQYKLLLKKV